MYRAGTSFLPAQIGQNFSDPARQIMRLIEKAIAGVYEAQAEPFQDRRGQFSRWFCHRELAQAQGKRRITQINHSVTRRVGTIRGLHFQHHPHTEAKWVRCLKGRVFDVAVDLRKGSATFLHWYATELAPQHRNVIFIPEGCAHGFQVLEPDSELLYLHTGFYEPSSEAGVRFDEPRLNINWPLVVGDVSERDLKFPLLETSFEGLDP